MEFSFFYSLAIRLAGEERELFALLCVPTVCVLFLFLMGPWVGEQPMIVAFPGQRSLLFWWKGDPRFESFRHYIPTSLRQTNLHIGMTS